jgi:hypothetical protein
VRYQGERFLAACRHSGGGRRGDTRPRRGSARPGQRDGAFDRPSGAVAGLTHARVVLGVFAKQNAPMNADQVGQTPILGRDGCSGWSRSSSGCKPARVARRADRGRRGKHRLAAVDAVLAHPVTQRRVVDAQLPATSAIGRPVLRTRFTASRFYSLVSPRRVRWGPCLCSSPMRTSSHPRRPASGEVRTDPSKGSRRRSGSADVPRFGGSEPCGHWAGSAGWRAAAVAEQVC